MKKYLIASIILLFPFVSSAQKPRDIPLIEAFIMKHKTGLTELKKRTKKETRDITPSTLSLEKLQTDFSKMYLSLNKRVDEAQQYLYLASYVNDIYGQMKQIKELFPAYHLYIRNVFKSAQMANIYWESVKDMSDQVRIITTLIQSFAFMQSTMLEKVTFVKQILYALEAIKDNLTSTIWWARGVSISLKTGDIKDTSADRKAIAQRIVDTFNKIK